MEPMARIGPIDDIPIGIRPTRLQVSTTLAQNILRVGSRTLLAKGGKVGGQMQRIDPGWVWKHNEQGFNKTTNNVPTGHVTEGNATIKEENDASDPDPLNLG